MRSILRTAMLFSPDSTFESAPPKSSCDFNSSQLSAQLYKTCSCSCNTGKSCILGSLGSGCGIKHWRTSTDLWWSGRLERFKPSSTPAPWGKTKALGLLPGAENAQECLITVLQCLRGSCKENGRLSLHSGQWVQIICFSHRFPCIFSSVL